MTDKEKPELQSVLTVPVDRKSLAHVPHIDQWMGVWLIEPRYQAMLTGLIGSMDLGQHLQRGLRIEAPTVDDYLSIDDGIATIKIHGVLQKHVMSVGTASSTVLIRKAIRQAVADDSVTGLLLDIESPGGTASGTMELGEEINKAKAIKPAHAHVTDMGCSAAYWVASQATRLTANKMAMVGSMGTYQVVTDLSQAAASEGIKVHVVRAGQYKGVGQPGTEITPDQLTYLQEITDDLNDQFLQGVADGRGVPVEVVKGWADGRCQIASKALALQWIDDVESIEQATENIRETTSARRGVNQNNSNAKTYPTRQLRMSDSSTADQPKEPTVLTPKQIKDACPGCTNDFVVQCIEDELTIEQCGRRHVENLAKQNATLKAERDEANAKALAAEDELAKAKAEAESAATTKSGVEGLKESQTSEASESSATDEFWQAVGELEAKGMARHEAIAKVHKRNPELRQAMLAEINA